MLWGRGCCSRLVARGLETYPGGVCPADCGSPDLWASIAALLLLLLLCRWLGLLLHRLPRMSLWLRQLRLRLCIRELAGQGIREGLLREGNGEGRHLVLHVMFSSHGARRMDTAHDVRTHA